MKSKITPIITAIVIIFAVVYPVFSQSPPPSPTATDSAIVNIEDIKENVKKRIQEVVKEGAGNSNQIPTAYTGVLKSRTGNTLSIETDYTIKLASISAATSTISLPDNILLDPEDISLEDYLAALGYMGSDEVLQTKRLIVHKTVPKLSQYQTFFGQVVAYDTKTYTLTLSNPIDSSEKEFIVSRKAEVKQMFVNDTSQTQARSKAIPENASLLAVYLPAETDEDDNVAYFAVYKTRENNHTPLDDQPTPGP